MDIIFEPQKGRPFSIEIGFFDTVVEIKEKVQKYQGIPVARQTLVFNGQVLQDDRDVEQCVLLQNSRVQLLVAPEADKPAPPPAAVVVKTEPPSSSSSPSPSRKIQLKINIPSSKGASVAVEMDASDTVLRLKEKIHEMEPLPVSRMVVQSSGEELQDHRALCEYELNDNTEIDVNIRPSPTSTGSATSTGSKRLKLMVLPKGGTKKIPVEVNASDSVKVLKEELQKLHQRPHFHLPQEGYFFIYKQNVMDDERSFKWHKVAQGDTIEIFNGSVTGGS